MLHHIRFLHIITFSTFFLIHSLLNPKGYLHCCITLHYLTLHILFLFPFSFSFITFDTAFPYLQFSTALYQPFQDIQHQTQKSGALHWSFGTYQHQKHNIATLYIKLALLALHRFCAFCQLLCSKMHCLFVLHPHCFNISVQCAVLFLLLPLVKAKVQWSALLDCALYRLNIALV